MGVHGLTTFLRENQRVLGKTKQFPLAHVSGDTITTIVVDGLSFIFEVYEQSRLPWVYGGEYEAFARCVVQVVEAWIAVGLKVYFVFDGASPDLKIPTMISRLNRTNVQNSLLFFRTSPTSRSTPRFLHENRIIPPLVLLSCVETLKSFAKANSELEVHFADEEGDPYAVELAGRLGAYVVGNDSDFVILNSGRYAGYIPLEEMLWTASLPVNESPSTHEDREDGFQTVMNKTKKRVNPTPQQTSFGLIPPEETPLSDLVLSVIVYTPSTLASHLKLPTTLLPLLASLVGNDFTNKSTTQRNRITRTANTLSSILSAATQKHKAKHRVGSVMDLIDRTVNALLVRSSSSLATGEIDGIVDRIVNAALQYAIDKYEGDMYGPASLWPTPICALHGSDTCPLPNLFSRALSQKQEPGNVNGTAPEDGILMLRSLYLKAFRAGKLQPKVADVLSTGTFWPRIFLDNPDSENVAISIGRPIRSWIYALLEDGVGLPEAPEEKPPAVDGSVSEGDEAEEDPNELIDVVEEDSDEEADLLAPLRGELRRLRGTGEDSAPASATSRSRSRPPAPPKCVTEYVRRGTRIASEQVRVPDLAALMTSSGFDGSLDSDAWVPVQLRSLEERVALFLHILGSNVPCCQKRIARPTHGRPRAEMDLANTPSTDFGERHEQAGHTSGKNANSPSTMPLTDRNVQLMAQILTAIETIHLLSQVLFLTDKVPANIQVLSGEKFHAYLSSPTPVPAAAILPGLWDACTASLGDAFALERQQKVKKPKVEQVNQVAKANSRTTTRPGQGLFSLLVDDVA
ncbi:hypothetical protein J3R83DRAFT_2748 [Lanmaoa asiatica]|nr:hypothetical protein J3R83DRAFT_2748 [Lanmaoa asiatica]